MSIEEMVDELRGFDPELENYVRGLMVAGRQYVETLLKRQFVTATYDWRLDCFPPWEIEIPLPPLQSVTSITYVDVSGTSTVFSSSNYSVDIYSEPGRVTPTYDQTWPSTRYQNNAVTIRFVCGYGLAVSVPQSIKAAIKAYTRAVFDGCDLDHAKAAVNSLVSSEYWGCYA